MRREVDGDDGGFSLDNTCRDSVETPGIRVLRRTDVLRVMPRRLGIDIEPKRNLNKIAG